MGKPMTWDELASFYDKHCGGRKARTLPMDKVIDWAENNHVYMTGPAVKVFEGTIEN